MSHTNPRAVMYLGLGGSRGAPEKKCSELCDQLVRGKLNWEGSCLCPSSCKLQQLQNKPADPCAEKGCGPVWIQKVPGLMPVGRKWRCLDSLFRVCVTGMSCCRLCCPFCQGSGHCLVSPQCHCHVLGLCMGHTVLLQLEQTGAGGGSESNHCLYTCRAASLCYSSVPHLTAFWGAVLPSGRDQKGSWQCASLRAGSGLIQAHAPPSPCQLSTVCRAGGLRHGPDGTGWQCATLPAKGQLLGRS